MSTGSWEDHWERGRFISGGQLLRWPEDRREPNPITPVIRAELFARAAEADDRDRFVLDHISVYTPEWVVQHPEYWGDDSGLRDQLNRFWRLAHMNISEICAAANIKITELSERTTIPYRTLMSWNKGERRFPTYDRLLILHFLGLMPEL